jgi:hypothetical protein
MSDELLTELMVRIAGLEHRVEALEWLSTDEQLVDAHTAIRAEEAPPDPRWGES